MCFTTLISFHKFFPSLRKRGAAHVTGSNRCDTRYVSGVYGSKNIKGLEAYDARMQLRSTQKSLPPGSTFSMPDSKQVPPPPVHTDAMVWCNNNDGT